MNEKKKAKCTVRHGYDAMDRIEEAGELIQQLFGDHYPETLDAVDYAYRT